MHNQKGVDLFLFWTNIKHIWKSFLKDIFIIPAKGIFL